MKKFLSLLLIAILGGAISLGSYKLFFEEENAQTETLVLSDSQPNVVKTNFHNFPNAAPEDFTEAAKNTVHAVVHVKNVTTAIQPRNMFEYMQGVGVERKMLRGTGSGVIITPDGYIVTNNHVIEGATEIQVTLNDNRTYTAEIVGSDQETDIALLKIDAENLDYIPFGNSNNVETGQWVLAVGNPFNLTSTVTAGIVSAKARDLNRKDQTYQSFIQTDAAINMGNSGGALVNTSGELVGINTAITSMTGSYIGYAFAVPSNTVRRVVEDILEYGDVRDAIMGVSVVDINSSVSEQLDLDYSQGLYVNSVTDDGGAKKAGLREGDIILKVDDLKITKFAELSGYLNGKRPGDIVNITYSRNGNTKQTNVKLTEYIAFSIYEIGLEVTNVSEEKLASFGVDHGVQISRALDPTMEAQNLAGIVITDINQQPVGNVEDVKKIINNSEPENPISVTFAGPGGEKRTFVFR
jgi:Do/DeqQ family serine protease